MTRIARVLTWIVAVAHLWFMVLESVLWTTPFAQRALHMSAELAEANKILAMNQGAYNGVLSAGLVWALFSARDQQRPRATFFLASIVIMGIIGAATSGQAAILLLQAAPALAALVAVRRSE